MGKQCQELRKNKFQVEVVDVAATKRARRKYVKEQHAASRGKAARRSRGSGRASASGPVEPTLTPEEVVPPVMVCKPFRWGGQERLSDIASLDLEGY